MNNVSILYTIQVCHVLYCQNVQYAFIIITLFFGKCKLYENFQIYSDHQRVFAITKVK
jgi:hypothetical protein